MGIFSRKKKPDRRVFGFLCYTGLSSHIRFQARVLQVPIYCLCEHMLELGLAHIRAELDRSPQDFQVALEELKEHLVCKHLLVGQLTNQAYEEAMVTRHMDSVAKQEEDKLRVVVSCLEKLEEHGIPREMAIEVLERAAVRLYGRYEFERKRRKLEQETDFKVLQKINERLPAVVPRILALMAQYSLEDLTRVLSSRQ